MMSDIHLDRVSLDGLLLRRRSATLRSGAGTHPGTRRGAWWVALACDAIPRGYDVSPRRVWMDASTVSGRRLRAQVRIVDRRDDAYGTQLILVGLSPASIEALWPSSGS